MKMNKLRQAWAEGFPLQGVVYLGLVTLFSLAIIGLAIYVAWVEKQRGQLPPPDDL
ncbi:MAG: hypothetical protein NHG36_18825 [Chromatiaceae bacterium]|nr:hypothetical protein [Candidatus Thioaporhodococcus sediminis]